MGGKKKAKKKGTGRKQRQQPPGGSPTPRSSQPSAGGRGGVGAAGGEVGATLSAPPQRQGTDDTLQAEGSEATAPQRQGTAPQRQGTDGTLQAEGFEATALKAVVAAASLCACDSRGADTHGGGHMYCFECGAVGRDSITDHGPLTSGGGRDLGALPKLLTCSRCKIARYCSKECQKAAWKSEYTLSPCGGNLGHKTTCAGYVENRYPPDAPDEGKCAAICAASSGWLDEDGLDACLEIREQLFFRDPSIPDVLHLSISCTNSLGSVRLGISPSFWSASNPVTYAMDLIYKTIDEGERAEALLGRPPSGDLSPAARNRAMDEIVEFADRAVAAGKGPCFKSITIGRGMTWLANGPQHDSLMARLKAAGLCDLSFITCGANHGGTGTWWGAMAEAVAPADEPEPAPPSSPATSSSAKVFEQLDDSALVAIAERLDVKHLGRLSCVSHRFYDPSIQASTEKRSIAEEVAFQAVLKHPGAFTMCPRRPGEAWLKILHEVQQLEHKPLKWAAQSEFMNDLDVYMETGPMTYRDEVSGATRQMCIATVRRAEDGVLTTRNLPMRGGVHRAEFLVRKAHVGGATEGSMIGVVDDEKTTLAMWSSCGDAIVWDFSAAETDVAQYAWEGHQWWETNAVLALELDLRTPGEGVLSAFMSGHGVGEQDPDGPGEYRQWDPKGNGGDFQRLGVMASGLKGSGFRWSVDLKGRGASVGISRGEVAAMSEEERATQAAQVAEDMADNEARRALQATAREKGLCVGALVKMAVPDDDIPADAVGEIIDETGGWIGVRWPRGYGRNGHSVWELKPDHLQRVDRAVASDPADDADSARRERTGRLSAAPAPAPAPAPASAAEAERLARMMEAQADGPPGWTPPATPAPAPAPTPAPASGGETNARSPELGFSLHRAGCECGCTEQLPPFTDRICQTPAYHRRLMQDAGVTDLDEAEAGVCKGRFCCPGCDAEQVAPDAPDKKTQLMKCTACTMVIINPMDHATVEGSTAHKAMVAKDEADRRDYERFVSRTCMCLGPCEENPFCTNRR